MSVLSYCMSGLLNYSHLVVVSLYWCILLLSCPCIVVVSFILLSSSSCMFVCRLYVCDYIVVVVLSGCLFICLHYYMLSLLYMLYLLYDLSL